MNRVARYTFLLVIWGCFSAPAFAQQLQAFSVSADPAGGAIIVKWSTTDESGIVSFDIYRRAGGQGDFIKIGAVPARGVASDYVYADHSVFKVEDGRYEYKLRVMLSAAPPVDTKVAEISFLSSTARRTWGSIKAMFR